MQQPMQPLPQQPLPQQPLPQQPPPQQPPALPPGTLLLGRYLIQGYIGGGGFGHIYKAQDKILGHRRAIKEAFYRDMQTQRQFRLEAEFILNARHPNLVRGYAVFEQGGRFYLVMDYVDGQTVEEIAIQYIRRSGRPLPEAQVLDWVLPICDAVHALHSQPTPIIHRDVKPANIKITRAGSPMLIDLGLAKLYNQGMQTVGAALAFTPGYAPPEQYQASGSTDQRTDVYGLGATLFYLLTGYQPTEAPARLGPHTLPSPRVLNPAISVLTEAAVFKAMALDPARRQQSAHELDLELRAARAALDVGRAASGELSEAVARQAPCAQCGTANVATARFCMRCGAVLHHVAELAAPAVAARLREPERVVVGMAMGGHQPAAVVASPPPSPAPLPPPALAPMPAPAPLPAPARPRIPTPLPTPAPAAAPTPVAGRQAGLAAQLPPAETHPEPVPIGAQPPRVPAARAPLPAAEAAPASEPQASTSAARGAFYRTSVTLNRDPEEARTVVATILAVVCVSLSFLALVAGWAIVFAAPAAVLSGWSWYRDHDDMPPELRVIAPSALVLATLWPPIWIGIAAPGGWKLLALAWLVVVGAWPAGRLAYQYWLDRNERFYS